MNRLQPVVVAKLVFIALIAGMNLFGPAAASTAPIGWVTFESLFIQEKNDDWGRDTVLQELRTSDGETIRQKDYVWKGDTLKSDKVLGKKWPLPVALSVHEVDFSADDHMADLDFKPVVGNVNLLPGRHTYTMHGSDEDSSHDGTYVLTYSITANPASSQESSLVDLTAKGGALTDKMTAWARAKLPDSPELVEEMRVGVEMAQMMYMVSASELAEEDKPVPMPGSRPYEDPRKGKTVKVPNSERKFAVEGVWQPRVGDDLNVPTGIFADKAAKIVWVASRGSASATDWSTNAQFIPMPWIIGSGLSMGYVHVGFAKAFGRLTTITAKEGTGRNAFSHTLEAVRSAMAKAKGNEDPQKDLLFDRIDKAILSLGDPKEVRTIFVGHSLGGAMAQMLASAWFCRRLGPPQCKSVAEGSATADIPRPVVFSFGAPRVGSLRSFEKHQRNLVRHFRIVNENDPVASVPPGPQHVSDSSFGLFPDDSRCYRSMHDDDNPGYTVSMSRHYIDKYVAHIFKCWPTEKQKDKSMAQKVKDKVTVKLGQAKSTGKSLVKATKKFFSKWW